MPKRLAYIATLLVVASIASGEVGPSTQEMLREAADVIVYGRIQKITSQRQPSERGSGIDRAYKIWLSNESAEKQDRPLGNQVVAHGWEALSRPHQTVGSSGHYFMWRERLYRLNNLTKGNVLRAYLKRHESGRLVLLLPNGVEWTGER